MDEKQHRKLVEKLSSLIDERFRDLEKKAKQLIEDKFKVFNNRHNIFQKSLDRIDSDMAEDRKAIGKIPEIQAKLEDLQDYVYNRQTPRIINKVEDTIEQSMETNVSGSVDRAIKDTFDLKSPENQKKKSLWRRLLRQ